VLLVKYQKAQKESLKRSSFLGTFGESKACLAAITGPERGDREREGAHRCFLNPVTPPPGDHGAGAWAWTPCHQTSNASARAEASSVKRLSRRRPFHTRRGFHSIDPRGMTHRLPSNKKLYKFSCAMIVDLLGGSGNLAQSLPAPPSPTPPSLVVPARPGVDALSQRNLTDIQENLMPKI